MKFHARALTAAVAALAWFLCGTAAFADLDSGTQVYAVLRDAIDSKTARVGDPVVLRVQSLYPDQPLNTTVQGATINAHVSEAVAATPTKKAHVTIAMDTITLTDGRTFPFNGQVVQVVQQKRTNAGQAAGEVVGGMIAGNILGKWLGTNYGGLIGAAGGALYASQMSQNVRIPENSTVKIVTSTATPITPAYPQTRQPQ